MIYVLEGHELVHAVEEMLFQLFPTLSVRRATEADREVIVHGTNPVTTVHSAETAHLAAPVPSVPPPESTESMDYCRSTLTQTEERTNGESSAPPEAPETPILTTCVTTEVHLHGQTYWGKRSASFAMVSPLERKRIQTGLVKRSLYDAAVQALPQPPVWGSLTGVRPAKLVRGFLESGMTRGEAAEHLRTQYGVSSARTALTMRAAATALSVAETTQDTDISLYVGIPFCPSRCYYCSFVSSTTAQSQHLIEPYLETLLQEIEQTAALVREAGRPVQSIYIGGGTPTTLSEAQLQRLLAALAQHFDLSTLREYTVEAGRPDTITPAKLRVLKEAGVGRVSINPQSMADAVLERIGRKHTADDVRRAYAAAREIGFAAINMDLIAGLAGDTVETFTQTLQALLDLAPENITIHTLAIKRGADLSDKAAVAQLRNVVGEMLSHAAQMLGHAQYGPYYLYRQKFSAGGFENVGWCQPGTECFYNIVMMEELHTILALGAGGVSKRVDRHTGWIARRNNPKYPLEYIQAAPTLLEGKRQLLFPENER